jgi:hypothetical protein
MTDAELSRQEWIEERIAILEESNVAFGFDARRMATEMWCFWTNGRARNAARSHGDGSGAHDGCTDSHA